MMLFEYPVEDWNLNSCWKHNKTNRTFVLVEKCEQYYSFKSGDEIEIHTPINECEKLWRPT